MTDYYFVIVLPQFTHHCYLLRNAYKIIIYHKFDIPNRKQGLSYSLMHIITEFESFSKI